MNSLDDPLLIVGLGNPGLAYEETRHNIGFVFVREIARGFGCSLSLKKDFKAEFGQTLVEGKKVMFLLPMTYMNLSGEAVKKCVDFFKILPSRVMVVCDDVALDLGKLRLRPKGSCGGHNGLRSIEKMLQTMDYGRLKVGVGSSNERELADYVLGRFSSEEKKVLEETIQRAKTAIDFWIKEGATKAIEEIGRAQNKNRGPKKDQSAGEEKKVK